MANRRRCVGGITFALLLSNGCGGGEHAAVNGNDFVDSGDDDAGSGDRTEGPLSVRLDPSFASSGTMGGELSVWTPVGVAIDAAGRILVAGPSNDPSSPPAEIVRRFATDGSLDSTFGASGHVALPGSPDQMPQALRYLPDGRIGILGGASLAGVDGPFAGRLMANGATDLGFDGGALPSAGIGAYRTGLWQDDGTLFVFGAEAAVHTQVGGQVDASYGAGGRIAAATAGALANDGRLWTGLDSRVSRYLASGTPDPTFGDGGAIELAWGAAGSGPPTIQRLLGQSAGGAVIIGAHASAGVDYVDVTRLTADGAVDTTFAAGALVSTQTDGGPVGAQELEDGRLLVWTAGGALIVVGPDGALEGIDGLDVEGTVLAATLDGAQRLVVVGMITADPTSAEWFVSRYLLL